MRTSERSEKVNYSEIYKMVFVRPAIESVLFNGSKQLAKFTVSHVEMCMEDADTVTVNFILERQLLGFLMTTCLPTVIVNIVGHLTIYFQVLFNRYWICNNRVTNVIYNS